MKKEEAYVILAPLTKKLGIELRLVDELPMLQEAADEVKSQFAF
ncbi:hypothetical protein [Ammoniphilus sp. YIM 78166]|nr:hypothetical protein [Ammoniphilus sp. YIM 78166]